MERTDLDKRLYESVLRCIKKEAHDLQYYGRGIFGVPEVYLAIQIGKQNVHDEVFGKAEWISERNVPGSNGPVDIIFEGVVKNHFIEMKTCSTHNLYLNDIRKLRGIKDKGNKYFLALVNAYSHDGIKDKRSEVVNKERPRLSSLVDNFQVINKGKGKEICCVVAMWRVL